MSSHIEKAREYISIAESGDAKREAYTKAADEILAAKAEDPTLTQRQIGEQLDKSRTWIQDLLRWHKARDHGLPFSNVEAAARYRERQVPTRHEDRVEMAATLLADLAVVEGVLAASSTAQRHIENAVHDKSRGRREQAQDREQQRRQDVAQPLPAYMAAMVLKLDEWAGALAVITDADLEDLPVGHARELVLAAAEGLVIQGQRWISVLSDRPGLQVIEGRAAS